MNLRLNRIQYGQDGVFGELLDEEGQLIAHTLEHAYADGTYGLWLPKVAMGTYRCTRHAPNRLKYETFMLEEVPDFQGKPVSGILIHCGNFDKDSEGCILVGKGEYDQAYITQGPMMMLTHSRDAFAKLMAVEDGIESFLLLVC